MRLNTFGFFLYFIEAKVTVDAVDVMPNVVVLEWNLIVLESYAMETVNMRSPQGIGNSL